MRKEAVYAIIFGIFIGLTVAFGLFRINSTMKKIPEGNKSQIQTNAENENAEEQGTNSITLLKPFDRQVLGEDTVTVSGVTKAESYIVATGGTYDLVSQSRKDGTFDFEYEIEPSLNLVNIYSVTNENKRSSVSLQLVYSSEASSVDSDEEDTTEEKLENVQNMAEFYQGTVTDITEGGIQIKTKEGEIKQISYIKEETSFAKVAKSTGKISAGDIALGDYVLALGYKQENGLLNAFRILVTQPATIEDIRIFFGTVQTKNKADMLVSESGSGDVNVEIDNNTKTYRGTPDSFERARFADLSQGDIVIGTYFTDDNVNISRRIYLLETPSSD